MTEVHGSVCPPTRHRFSLQLDVSNLDVIATKFDWGRQRIHFVDGRARFKTLKLVEPRDLDAVSVELSLVQEVLRTVKLELVGSLHSMIVRRCPAPVLSVQECPIILVLCDMTDGEAEWARIALNQFSLQSLLLN